ncbi:hypothetical protein Noda2021_01440 [Candidatus Dependentiae bacterium Noda2021]|nr:hypothetical protein Noda2021_01440 [Candidatus Dependentiae bacterium Noda2021]
MNIVNTLHTVLGIHAEEILISHMMMRSLVIYIVGIILARFNKRFMSLRTVDNFFLYILIGSILASAIVGNVFYETLGMAIFIMFVNWSVVVIDYYFPYIGSLISGKKELLIDNGVVQHRQLKKFFITEDELLTAMRVNTHTSDVLAIKKAYFENNGQLSFELK